MIANHVVVLFSLAILLMALKILPMPSFTNGGLVLYGISLVLFLVSPNDLFLAVANNMLELGLYLGILSFYMIIKGFFDVVNMLWGVNQGR